MVASPFQALLDYAYPNKPQLACLQELERENPYKENVYFIPPHDWLCYDCLRCTWKLKVKNKASCSCCDRVKKGIFFTRIPLNFFLCEDCLSKAFAVPSDTYKVTRALIVS